MADEIAVSELFSMRNRTAIVTGASSGLGEHFSRVLHAAGANVVAVARRHDRLTELSNAHERITAQTADVTDDEAMRAVVDHVVDRFGGVDVLVNNAGAGAPVPAVEENLDAFRSSLELNLIAVFNLCRLVAVPMLGAGRGSIINIASIFGLGSSWPIPNGGYTAAKGGVINLTRELGCQWAEAGVRVNAIAPGFFPTESTRGVTEDAKVTAFVRRRTPMRRTGELRELDGPMLFLASDASSFMTGQTITVDGGWSAY